ncbi:mycofactocin-coupled SDR family oxidoreductase [Pseudofrankia sp. BMG5.37]|uniref:mycofactocin-coupled SDR family oxidoreductase n=1 Tax=Pseudofrankia sp. BMG5.37 TaxID=3050035 RepID=UPI0028938C37|nr:mycofactocin-coupled SDR family oxidoreductase [Pseudofrankia sp. BMG5.37]MDT3444937.1 mycofactocin-coupled SDR family oxidoreductase [Pseudofrankia sp. BMG5.37]
MGRVDGKIALVTGAARGQGRNHAWRFAEQGADVIVLDICADLPTIGYALGTKGELDETAAGVEARGRRVAAAQVDVRDAERLDAVVSAAVSQLGGLDVVSVNAGVCGFGNVLDLTAEEWKEQIDVNLTGSFNTAKATIPHILSQGRGGSVIFTASTCGLQAVPGIGHYNASKFGVVGLTKTLALELGEQGVRVNAVCPTNVATPMFQNDLTWKLFFPDVQNPSRADAEAPNSAARQMHTIPIPWVEVDDVTNAVMYLASDDSRYVTGTTLVVDAGRTL